MDTALGGAVSMDADAAPEDPVRAEQSPARRYVCKLFVFLHLTLLVIVNCDVADGVKFVELRSHA